MSLPRIVLKSIRATCRLIRSSEADESLGEDIDALFDEGAEAEIGSGAFAFTMGAWNRLS